jgi:hypothetical protein
MSASAIALLVSCHHDEQVARRTDGKRKQTALLIELLATIVPDLSLWQIACLSLA